MEGGERKRSCGRHLETQFEILVNVSIIMLQIGSNNECVSHSIPNFPSILSTNWPSYMLGCLFTCILGNMITPCPQTMGLSYHSSSNSPSGSPTQTQSWRSHPVAYTEIECVAHKKKHSIPVFDLISSSQQI